MAAKRARALGVARLLLAALTLQLVLPALGLTGAVASISGEEITICSANGLQVVSLDGGQPANGTRESEPPCVFCLPLLGAAPPPADATPAFAVAWTAEPALPPDAAPRKQSLHRFQTGPRAPPLSFLTA